MGRSLDKIWFGEPTSNDDKITINFYASGALRSGWILEQVATGEYIATNGTYTARVELVNHTPVAEGEGAIVVTPFGSIAHHAKNILAHRVKTFEGGNYKWSKSAATQTGEADLPLA
jgi:hypothetical protein